MRVNVLNMTRRITSLLLVLLPISIFAQKAKQECYDYLKAYTPNSFGIIKLIDTTPSKFIINGIQINLGSKFSPETYFRGKTETDKIRSLNTVIHESHHQFNSVYAYQLLSKSTSENYAFGDEYSSFYYADDYIVLVKHTEVFNSNELKKEIPKELQSFRYKPYITPKSNLSSQAQGIYGLMDEFHSYYLGTKAGMETFTYFEEKARDNISVYLDFISNTSSNYWAFYEFKYFCLKYLQKAKIEYPEIYNELLSNEKLRQIYTKTSTAFEALVEEFHQKEKQIMQQAKAAGVESYIEDGYFWIGSNGVGNSGEETELLIAEINKPEFLALHKAFILN